MQNKSKTGQDTENWREDFWKTGFASYLYLKPHLYKEAESFISHQIAEAEKRERERIKEFVRTNVIPKEEIHSLDYYEGGARFAEEMFSLLENNSKE